MCVCVHAHTHLYTYTQDIQNKLNNQQPFSCSQGSVATVQTIPSEVREQVGLNMGKQTVLSTRPLQQPIWNKQFRFRLTVTDRFPGPITTQNENPWGNLQIGNLCFSESNPVLT